MEDVKWLLKKCGLPILILLFAVIAGVICWGKLHTEERKVAEEVWEPPVEIENSEATTEADAETSTESAYWFIPQSKDYYYLYLIVPPNQKYHNYHIGAYLIPSALNLLQYHQ